MYVVEVSFIGDEEKLTENIAVCVEIDHVDQLRNSMKR